ncbi:MAG: tRNA-dihydrouridine synthase, partial [Prevotella sp.]|nr:tRNA-dihydrouridine synthase [Prevotella sp.]
IPIIGNGDIKTREDVEHAFNDYGVDAVMIGRATFGAPWIFSELKGAGKPEEKERTERTEILTISEKIDILQEQLRINIERIDEYRGILHTRRHLAASPIFKGIPDFRQTRIRMLRAETEAELTAILEECRQRLTATER